MKQMIQAEQTCNIFENPNTLVANQLAVYKSGQGFELGANVKQIQVVVKAGLEAGTTGLRESEVLTSQPHYLLG